MTTQPDALRLADLLEMGSIWQDQEKAAAELRRLRGGRGTTRCAAGGVEEDAPQVRRVRLLRVRPS